MCRRRSSVARALDLSFGRVQFTPDLLPADITGTDVLNEVEAGAVVRRELSFMPGPIFHNLVLADEINRTPPKTQAALLQAMQERCVTVGGRTHRLPDPFQVFATQNMSTSTVFQGQRQYSNPTTASSLWFLPRFNINVTFQQTF